MWRICVLALMTAALGLTATINVGSLTWQHENGGVGWFSVEARVNDPMYPTTSNIRLGNVKLIVQTSVGGLFEYSLALGPEKQSTVPVGEPGVVWQPTTPGSYTVDPQVNPGMKYFTRGFDPAPGIACSYQSLCVGNDPVNYPNSTDMVVRAVLAYSVTILDPSWIVNTVNGPMEFVPNQPSGYVHYAELIYARSPQGYYEPLPYTGTVQSLSTLLTIDGQYQPVGVPEPGTTGLALAGLAFVLYRRRMASKLQ